MWKPIILILLVIFIGVIGFHIIEDWPLFDSLYMTVITIFTVGFKEVRDLSPLGRVFTIFIILGGVGTVLFAFTKAAEIVFEGGMRKFWRRRKMEKGLKNLNGHYIICGYGRMGKIVSERLYEENLPFVIIENNPAKIEITLRVPDKKRLKIFAARKNSCLFQETLRRKKFCSKPGSKKPKL